MTRGTRGTSQVVLFVLEVREGAEDHTRVPPLSLLSFPNKEPPSRL